MPTESPSGETLSTKIEPILGSVKYEARSHYLVFSGDPIHLGVLWDSVKKSHLQSKRTVSTYQDGS